MHKLISKKYIPFLNIYDPVEFLLPFFESPAMQRLSNIWMYCGTEYCKFYNYNMVYTRLDHSLWVANIIRHFTKDKKQTLAGFFHDISHTVFSHVGDFYLWDTIKQESSEQHTKYLIEHDPIIIKHLKKLNITIEEVEDYTQYPIADNKSPKLSADRLEYTLSTMYALWEYPLEKIKKIYDNLIILNNEEWEKEIGFQNYKVASIFWDFSIKNCEACYSSYESIWAMKFLSEIFKKAITKNLIQHKDLYYYTEKEFISLIEKSWDKEIQSMRNFYKQLACYKISRYQPKTEKYTISSIAKKRFIDPLVMTKNHPQRLSTLSKTFTEKKDYHLNRKEERITLDYTL